VLFIMRTSNILNLFGLRYQLERAPLVTAKTNDYAKFVNGSFFFFFFLPAPEELASHNKRTGASVK